MKIHYYVLLFLTICFADIYAADDRLEFKLTISPTEWNVGKDGNTNTPILIIWCVRNKTGDQITLPIGTPTMIELVDANNQNVPRQNSPITGSTAIANNEYRVLQPGYANYILSGLDLSFTLDNKKNLLLEGGGTMQHSGGFAFGPLIPGKYKIRCTFTTKMDPTEFAKKLPQKNLWLGDNASEWIDIIVK